MHIAAHLDVDLVAVETTDRLTLMLELEAPAMPENTMRAPATVQVVLDRSGSMGVDGRLDSARHALAALVDRLDPADRFGLVSFDDEVHVTVPAGPVTDKAQLKARIATVVPGGSTNLSGGLLRGLQEARRVTPDGSVPTVLLLSDGMANDGIRDPDELAAVAAGSAATISTIGIGLGYDETLLAAIARGARGNHTFAEAADEAAAVVAGEVSGLLSKTVQAASLLIRPTAGVASVALHNDLPAHGVEGGVMVELGDLWAGEQRTLLLGLEVPAAAGLGVAQVAELELRYVTVPGLVEETVTLPVSVNVVPGDQAAGRIPNPRVRQELLFQQVQKAKRDAADAIARGEDGRADAVLGSAQALMACAPASQELDQERRVLLELREDISIGEATRSSKRARMESSRKSHKRGR
jgi:Ca-activated chloride channel family protein